MCWQLANYSGTPIILIILAVLILAYTFVLNRSVFGRHIYAMGGNLFAAVMSGVKTKRVNFAIFVNIGVLAALAGVVSTVARRERRGLRRPELRARRDRRGLHRRRGRAGRRRAPSPAR